MPNARAPKRFQTVIRMGAAHNEVEVRDRSNGDEATVPLPDLRPPKDDREATFKARRALAGVLCDIHGITPRKEHRKRHGNERSKTPQSPSPDTGRGKPPSPKRRRPRKQALRPGPAEPPSGD